MFPSRERPLKFISLVGTDSGGEWASLTMDGRVTRVLSKRKYLSAVAKEDEVKRSTHLLVLDFTSLASLRLAHAALVHLTEQEEPLSRVSFIYSTTPETQGRARIVVAALATLRLRRALPFLIDYMYCG